MTNVPANTQGKTFLPVSSVFAGAPVEDLGEGIRTALAQLTIVSNVFGINHHGTYEGLPPAQSRQIEIVIIKSAKTQSKAFWLNGYQPGSKSPPDCWSSNSLTPDAQVPTPQSKSCATCINDAFVTGQNGLKQKPCGDSKRLAIVPAGDMLNEAYGGPMVFRVPAGSLAALDKYGYELKKFGVPYYAYTTWVTLTLDPKVQTTKLLFEQGRPLTDDEARIIMDMREDEKSGRIVNEVLIGYSEEEEGGTPSAPPAAAAPVQQRQASKAPPTPAAPVQQRQAPVAPTAQPAKAAPINDAVSKPASPPPTQRVVQTAPVEEVEEEAVEEGAVPDDMDALFGDLMSR